jgi:alcohol dehydrogenase class IV
MFRTDVIFNQFSSNPLYEDVCKGVKLFNANHCDTIVAVGGGSTIDVAKCIKLYCKMDPDRNYLQQEYTDSGIPLIAVPTTAGTGSESTRYAVIYFEGKKQSVTHDSIIPNYAILEPRLLKSLPLYQKKCTMLDALCQGIESLWSVNSTDESMIYSKIAIQLIMDHWHGYIEENSDEDAELIMQAANYAGRAINITQTTAAHAMSYKLTSMYGLPHGHAVALCLPEVWLYMLEHPEKCIDPRGEDHLAFVFEWLGRLMQCDSPEKGLMMFRSIMFGLDMPQPQSKNREEELDVLTQSVNPERLRNNPVKLDEDIIRFIYNRILL